jgi:hypothetical protein
VLVVSGMTYANASADRKAMQLGFELMQVGVLR